MPVHSLCAARVWPWPEMSSSSPSMVSSAQPRISDGFDAFAGHVPQAARQQVFLEHGADGVEVVLGRHVQHGVVFVVELAVRSAESRSPFSRSW
jgi:hypothetical protein